MTNKSMVPRPAPGPAPKDRDPTQRGTKTVPGRPGTEGLDKALMDPPDSFQVKPAADRK